MRNTEAMARGEAINITEKGIALGELVDPVTEVNEAFLAAARTMTAPSDLTPARWRVLSAVRDGARTVPSIASRVRMGMSRQGVQRLADELVSSGHARWKQNPAHRRSRLLEPTDPGFDALDAIISRQVTWANAVSAGLDGTDLRHAAETLGKVMQACADAVAPNDGDASLGG